MSESTLYNQGHNRRKSRRFLQCRDIRLELGGRTLIMGILNVTPDSFSDGGRYSTVEAAVVRARQMVEDGADIIDVGGESTRPGAQRIDADEELRRVIPVIEAIRGKLGVPISVDTYKTVVAERALAAGAHLLNDIWGLREQPDKAALAVRYDCPIILMHNRKQAVYERLMPELLADLEHSVQLARQAGVRDDQIVLDPGIGFGKTLEHNLTVMNHLQRLTALGYPVLLGTSRKSMIQKVLQLPADDVLEGTAATVALGVMQGCEMMRVHDVRQMKRVAMMCDAIVGR